MVNSAIQALGGALFPTRCCLCQWSCAGALPLCDDCRAELVSNQQCCQQCAVPLATGASVCGDCLSRPPHYDRVIAPWLYGEYLAYIIGRWKFHGDRALTPLLANLWHCGLPSSLPTVDLLVPVPLHWRRQWHRGYNQADLLATQLLNMYPWLMANRQLLRRRHATKAQAGMDVQQRSSNLSGAFTVSSGCDNLRVALIDDVLTTGATAGEAAGALKQAGAARVEIWCLARTPPPEKYYLG